MLTESTKTEIKRIDDMDDVPIGGPYKVIESKGLNRLLSNNASERLIVIRKNKDYIDFVLKFEEDKKSGTPLKYFKHTARIGLSYNNSYGSTAFTEVSGIAKINTLRAFDKYIKTVNVFPACVDLTRMVGSDPEFFVVDSNNEILPAFKFLGSKAKPNRTFGTDSYADKGVYWDGFQAEFETQNATCMQQHGDSIRRGLSSLNQFAKAHDPKAKILARPTIEVSLESLQTEKSEHVEFGCHPSFNAYGMQGLTAEGRETIYRSSGGHIHFGIGKLEDDVLVEIVKSLDAILGVACVSLLANFDTPLRRMYYGLAGEYRKPPHGLEYRVLSNAYMYSPMTTHLVFDVARQACNVGYNKLRERVWEAGEKEVIDTINNCDVDHARKILLRNKTFMLSLLRKAYKDDEYEGIHETMFDTFLNGMEHIVDDPTNIERNWFLDNDTHPVFGQWRGNCTARGASWLTSIDDIKKGVKF